MAASVFTRHRTDLEAGFTKSAVYDPPNPESNIAALAKTMHIIAKPVLK